MPSRSEVKSHAKAAELKDISKEISEGDFLVIHVSGGGSPFFTAVSFVGSDAIATAWEGVAGRLSIMQVEKAYDLTRIHRDAGAELLSCFLKLKGYSGADETLERVRTERRVLLVEAREGGFKAAAGKGERWGWRR